MIGERRSPKMGQICPKPQLRTGGTGYMVMAVLMADWMADSAIEMYILKPSPHRSN